MCGYYMHCIPQIAKAKDICQRKRGLMQQTKKVFKNKKISNEKTTPQITAIEYNEHKF